MNSNQTLEEANRQVTPAAVNSDIININYSQTRVVPCNDKVLEANRLISASHSGQWLESFRKLRTRCLQSMELHNWNSLAITSASAGTGNSVTAANLAISIALELNRTALLVDVNFKNPNIHKLFGLQVENGLSDYLLHDTPINQILINPGIERLTIMPSGRQPMLNSTEMLHAPKMLRLVKELKDRYPERIIIFDLPPILDQDDALGFAPYVDCLLLVVDEGKTSINHLKEAALLLKDKQVLGTVFNKSTDNKIRFNG
jgi:capsular exopolysaccharide synthesis family protein